MEISSITTRLDDIDEAIRLIELGKGIGVYYDQLAIETTGDTKYKYESKRDRVNGCHKSWVYDRYTRGKAVIKDFQYVLHCHDKFCPICQKLIATNREIKFKERLDDISKLYDCYHMVLTSPNVQGAELDNEIAKYSSAYTKLNKYLKGETKIGKLMFSQYGYVGGIRALEITWHLDDQKQKRLYDSPKDIFYNWDLGHVIDKYAMYHVHYHCLIFLKAGLDLCQYIYNKYSSNYKSANTDISNMYLFSDLEILIQKLWYLLLNNIKVTMSALFDTTDGYSCRVSLIWDGNYHEVFKYVTKMSWNDKLMPYEVFRRIEHATGSKRVIQGYGVMRMFGETADEIDERFDEAYDDFIALIALHFDKDTAVEHPSTIRQNILNKLSLYINRKKYRDYLRDNADISDIDIKTLYSILPKAVVDILAYDLVTEQLSMNIPVRRQDMPDRSMRDIKPTCK